jgi:predicted nucleotidyltransferase
MSGRQEIESRVQQIANLCREHGVARLLVFGSVLRDDFDPERSDIDLLVEFLPDAHKPWLGEFTDLKMAMEDLFSRKVDVISERALKNPYLLATVEREKELLYAA